jgi:hypothetical protein
MNNTLHTPGPWNLNGNGILLHPVTNAQLVTQRIETSLGSFEVLDETNEPEANANLISAAPDLLSALEKLLQISQDELDQSATHDGLVNCEALANARVAIAKAKGVA